jgi:hypothetical protein
MPRLAAYISMEFPSLENVLLPHSSTSNFALPVCQFDGIDETNVLRYNIVSVVRNNQESRSVSSFIVV